MLATTADPAAAGYDCLAPFYDRFTADYEYERWIDGIEHEALALGLNGWRALDLACGTGKSTEPLLRRGYSVLGCDISQEMIREARRKLPEHADSFVVADMRELPPLHGPFDLVLCLDDAINYLLTQDDLEAAFSSVASVLTPEGVFAFDVNSLFSYRTAFAQDAIHDTPGVFFAWRGEADADREPGDVSSAAVEIFVERDDGLWERRSMRHIQRHHTWEAIAAAMEVAGLRSCSSLGQRPGARLERFVDEQSQIKVVHFAKLSESSGEVSRVQTLRP
jgi:SAM-dependent methyltransferase